MSLLLDALRRAEQDSKKRKLADAETPVAAPDPAPAAPMAELMLEAQSPEAVPEPAAEEPLKLSETSAFGESTPGPSANFLDFELPAEDIPLPEPVVPASLAPRKASQPYGRYDRPAWEDSSSNWGALIANPVLSKKAGPDEAPSSRPAPIKAAARRAAETAADSHILSRPIEVASAKPPPKPPAPAPAISVTTPRQALSAAGVMAGRKKSASGSPGDRRRQLVLAAVALLLALPLVALLLFGDAIFGSSSSLVAVNPPAVSAPPAALPAPAPVAAVSDAAAIAMPPPDVVPASAPAPVVPPFRSTAAEASASIGPNAPARPRAQRSTPVRSTAAATPTPPVTATVRVAARPASTMESAFAAYQAGNTVEAARLYREVLQGDATQRDAWLGLAVIAHANNQFEPAMDAYRRVLRLEPQNATALAGVSSLRRAAGEPQQESRLRELLARSPQEADLNHALALVLSGEQRWSEAQPLFFKAHALAPKEPQFAYNLAVTLDHMRKSSLAAQYYETALGLAQGKAAGFDESNARTRLAALRAAR